MYCQFFIVPKLILQNSNSSEIIAGIGLIYTYVSINITLDYNGLYILHEVITYYH